MNVAANIIRLLHYAFIVFYVVAPFTKNDSLLLLHLMTGPLLWVHWYAMSDECSLTLIECWCRGIPYSERQESFFFNLVNPIYKFDSDADVRRFIWIASIALWMVTFAKVVNNPSILTNTFKQAWYGSQYPHVKKVEPEYRAPAQQFVSSPRDAPLYNAPQSRFSSIIV